MNDRAAGVRMKTAAVCAALFAALPVSAGPSTSTLGTYLQQLERSLVSQGALRTERGSRMFSRTPPTSVLWGRSAELIFSATGKPIDWASTNGAKLRVGTDPKAAVSGADCVITDTWVSMSDIDASNRHNLLEPFQVNDQLMANAAPDAIFMHCLPAHRDDEATSAVMDGPHSVIFDEAENRLHAQKALLEFLLA